MTKINNNSIARTNFDNSISRQTSRLAWWNNILRLKCKQPVISIIHLHGIIGKISQIKSGLTIESLNELIEKAFNTKNLIAVCLTVNSPGGSPVQSELIAKKIRLLAKEKSVPVYTFIEDVAASGGYWLACIGDKIFASKNSIIGSIGVIHASFGFADMIKKIGIERRVFSQGENKSILDPFKPIEDKDIKIIQTLQKQIHDNFIDYIKERRAGKLTQDDEILFNGKFWSGQTALDFGLIDGIDDMYNFINQKFGKVLIKHITVKQSWLKKTLGMSAQNLTQTLAHNVIDSLEEKNLFDIYKTQ